MIPQYTIEWVNCQRRIHSRYWAPINIENQVPQSLLCPYSEIKSPDTNTADETVFNSYPSLNFYLPFNSLLLRLLRCVVFELLNQSASAAGCTCIPFGQFMLKGVSSLHFYVSFKDQFLATSP